MRFNNLKVETLGQDLGISWLFTAVIVGIIAYLDWLIGVEVGMSIFYLMPVAWISWRIGQVPGIFTSIVCASLWYLMEVIGGREYHDPAIGFWNAFVRLSIFLIVAYLTSRLKRTLGVANEARRAALSANETKTAFLANMSHEIRTPMNAILGMADLLGETQLSAVQKNYVQIFKTEGRRLLHLINDLLDLSKIEAGRYEVEQIPVSIGRLVQEILSLVAVRVQEKGLNLRHDISDDVPERVISDPTLFRRILLNLLDNAIKFTSAGEVVLRVERNADSKSERLRVLVTDTGEGIDTENLSRIFDPFHQAESSISRRFGGTGLGLALVRGFAERMGGSVDAKSEKGKGSTFQIEIPLVRASTDTVLLEDTTDKELPVADERALRILLVEDYDINRQIVRAYLSETPYRIDEAENGAEGLERFKTAGYDLVLMDVQMPVMDGLAATTAIRAWEREKSRAPVPIVAFTAHAYAEDEKRSREAGCTAHLSKPFDKHSLLNMIQRATVDQVLVATGESICPPDRFAALDATVLELLPTFLKNMQSYAKSISEGLDRNDMAPAAACGHRIKGAGAVFGFPEISEVGAGIEDAAMKNLHGETLRLSRRLTDLLATVAVEFERRSVSGMVHATPGIEEKRKEAKHHG